MNAQDRKKFKNAYQVCVCVCEEVKMFLIVVLYFSVCCASHRYISTRHQY